MSLACGPGCDGLVNDMGTYENMSAADTRQGIEDIVGMEINTTDGVFTVTLDATDTESGATGVNIELSGSMGCIGLGGGGFFPYGAFSWEAGFDIVFDNCTGDSGSVYNGTISVVLSGPLGSVSDYDFTGRLNAGGPVDGRLDIDAHFSALSCLNWECWSGSVNGYSFARLY